MHNIHAIPVLKDNYVWTIIDDPKKQALIVDPGSASEVLQFLQRNNLSLAGIMVTHHHWDHINGISEIKSHYPLIPVYASKYTAIEGANHLLGEGDVVEFANFNFQVLEIPGHTLSHVAYYGDGVVFTGDTLFSAGCGRIFEGTPQQMLDSLRKLSQLPDDTFIYCGHEYTLNNLKFAELIEPNNVAVGERMREAIFLRKENLPTLPSTLQIEKKTNPFLRITSAELIANVEKFAQKKCDDACEVFKYLRAWKDGF